MDVPGSQPATANPASGGEASLYQPVDLVTKRRPTTLITFFLYWLLAIFVMRFLSNDVLPQSSDGIEGVLIVLSLLATILFIVLGNTIQRERAEDRLLALLRANQHGEIEERLAGGTDLRRAAERLAHVPRMLLTTLVTTGHLGAMIRVSRVDRGFFPPVQPIPVPFEPIHLDEAEAEFDDWRTGFDMKRRGNQTFGWAGGRLRRAMRIEGTHPAVLVVLVLVLTAIVGPWYMETMAVIALGLVVVIWVGYGRYSGVWVFPGGLFDRRRRQVFRRSNGLLCWHVASKRLYVMTGTYDCRVYKVTSAEAALAMRAWSSPAPSPTDEMLYAFFGLNPARRASTDTEAGR